jgi:hypothetical protein
LKLCGTSRPNLPQLTLFLLGVAVAVFTWGLQYKLSLYDPPQSISHEIPQAKLLSKDQQATVSEIALLSANTSTKPAYTLFWTMILVFLLASNRLYMPAAGPMERAAKRPWRISCGPSLNAFFFRPPPSLI